MMTAGTRPIFVLHRDRELIECVRNAALRSYTVAVVQCWRALHAALSPAPPSALTVVDPYFSETASDRLAPELRSLLVSFPSVPIFAAFHLRPGRGDDLRTLARLGMVEVISIGHDDTPQALRQRFRKVNARGLKTILQATLPEDTPGRARAIMDAAAETVTVAGNSRYMAHALGVSRRTLLRWTARAGVPPPRRLLAWVRILLAAELLDDPGRSVSSVARACGYADDSGLRSVMRRFVRASPSELRRIGAVSHAWRLFILELSSFRHDDA